LKLSIIKLGGSLIGSDELQHWLSAIERRANNENIIVVPGGGQYANLIRHEQRRLNYSELTAHRQAILSMCQTAFLFQEYFPRLKAIYDSCDAHQFYDKGLPLIWVPFELLEKGNLIAANWDITSDSLSLYLASKLSADYLYLIKSIVINQQEHYLSNYIKKGVIDKGFQSLIKYNESNIYIYSSSDFEYFSDLVKREQFRLLTN